MYETKRQGLYLLVCGERPALCAENRVDRLEEPSSYVPTGACTIVADVFIF